MTERRPAGRPSDLRSQARRKSLAQADWAEEELASARERLQAREAPRPERPPSSGPAQGFWITVIVVLAVELRAR